MQITLDTLVKYRALTIFFFAAFLAVLWTVMMNHSEFSHQELRFFNMYVAAIFAGQAAVVGGFLWLSKIWRGFEFLSAAVATMFTTANIYTLLVVHVSFLANLAMPLWAVLIAVMLLFFAIPYFVSWKPFVKFVHIFAVIMAVLVGVQLVGDSTFSVKGMFDKLPSHLRIVEFKKKPNVYVVSMDALAPAAVMKNNLGVEAIPYIDVLNDHDVRIIPNTFAERIPTKRSLNLLMAMDKEYFETVSEDGGFIRDQVPNPVYKIFRQNGYKIQVTYESRYFGDDKGRLDYYGIAKAYGVCTHVERKYAFMGYCRDDVQQYAKKYTNGSDLEYPKMLFDRIKETAQSEEPWFTFASIYKPGHAKNSMDYANPEDWAEYERKFIKASKRAAAMLDEMLSVIAEYDPDSITIVFGDHGSLLTKGAMGDARSIIGDAVAMKDDFRTDSPVSFEQVVQDRHAVLNFIMPSDACEADFSENPYSTMRIMRDVFKCLSEEDPLPANYQPDDDRWMPYVYQE